MMNEILQRYYLIVFLGVFLCSCSSANKAIRKDLKSNSKLEKSDLSYENELAIVFFDRELTLAVLKRELKNKHLTNCDKDRLIECIKEIEKRKANLFESLKTKDNTGFFVENFQKRILEILLTESEFSIFNKSTNSYEKYLTYNKKNGNGCCCFVDFEFPNKKRFINTRVATDIVIIEECEE